MIATLVYENYVRCYIRETSIAWHVRISIHSEREIAYNFSTTLTSLKLTRNCKLKDPWLLLKYIITHNIQNAQLDAGLSNQEVLKIHNHAIMARNKEDNKLMVSVILKNLRHFNIIKITMILCTHAWYLIPHQYAIYNICMSCFVYTRHQIRLKHPTNFQRSANFKSNFRTKWLVNTLWFLLHAQLYIQIVNFIIFFYLEWRTGEEKRLKSEIL